MTDCAHTAQRVVIEPDTSPHYARRVCEDCNRFLRWEPKPETQSARRPAYVRELVDRYGNGHCELCMRPDTDARGGLAAHHVIEYAQGGTSDRSNIWILCGSCHRLVHLMRKWYA